MLSSKWMASTAPAACQPHHGDGWVKTGYCCHKCPSVAFVCVCVCAVPLPSVRSFDFSWVNTLLCVYCYFKTQLKSWVMPHSTLPSVSANQGGYLQLTVAFLIPLRYAILVQVSVFELYFTVKKYYKANSFSWELPQLTRASVAESSFHILLSWSPDHDL